MTTRRWMLVVVAVALAFGGYREMMRLKRQRDRYFARATWHAGAEAYYLRLTANLAARKGWSDQEAEPPPETSTEVDQVIERWFGLPSGKPEPSDQDDRFAEAQARVQSTAVRRRKILADYQRKETESHRKLAEYHAGLRRKYMAAASRPWLTVEPDPPPPR
jgi:hypothetical protein